MLCFGYDVSRQPSTVLKANVDAEAITSHRVNRKHCRSADGWRHESDNAVSKSFGTYTDIGILELGECFF